MITTLLSLVIIGIAVVETQCFYWLNGKIPQAFALIRLCCLSLKLMACHAVTHEISGHRKIKQLACPMKDSRSWSHMSAKITNINYFCVLNNLS